MFKELIMWLAMPFFKAEMLELQRYRNVVSDVHRWCASDEKADKITQLIIDHGMSQCPYDISEFRKRLAYLDDPKRSPRVMFAAEAIKQGEIVEINSEGHVCWARASKKGFNPEYPHAVTYPDGEPTLPQTPRFDLGGENR